jgi:hypothetical protein
MRDNRDHLISLASSSVPDEPICLSRRGFLEMSAATAFLFGFPSRRARSAPLPMPRPLHRMPSSGLTGKGKSH